MLSASGKHRSAEDYFYRSSVCRFEIESPRPVGLYSIVQDFDAL
jgi:hypothetical protein